MSENETPDFQIKLRSRRVQRELDSLSEMDYRRVLAKLRTLSKNPRPQGCQKLADQIFRVRVGDIRIIYSIEQAERQILVGGIRRRSKRTYKDIDDLFN